jgi:hypothetical protein
LIIFSLYPKPKQTHFCNLGKLKINFLDEKNEEYSNLDTNPDLAEHINGLIGQTINTRYTVKKILGVGSYGQVFLVNDKIENKE